MRTLTLVVDPEPTTLVTLTNPANPGGGVDPGQVIAHRLDAGNVLGRDDQSLRDVITR